jgi:hypothetical protein
VAKLRSPVQFHGLGNMIYQNAGDNDDEVHKALYLWKIAMDKVATACIDVGLRT